MSNNDLLQLMHDTMGPLGRINQSVSFLKQEVSLTLEEKLKMLDVIETAEKELREVLDAYYLKTK